MISYSYLYCILTLLDTKDFKNPLEWILQLQSGPRHFWSAHIIIGTDHHNMRQATGRAVQGDCERVYAGIGHVSLKIFLTEFKFDGNLILLSSKF